jgi:hypothetical protein
MKTSRRNVLAAGTAAAMVGVAGSKSAAGAQAQSGDVRSQKHPRERRPTGRTNNPQGKDCAALPNSPTLAWT